MSFVNHVNSTKHNTQVVVFIPDKYTVANYCRDIEDLHSAVCHISSKIGSNVPKIIVGFSMGANTATKYVGDYCNKYQHNPYNILSLVSIGQGYDGFKCATLLKKSISGRIYSKRLVESMKHLITKQHYDNVSSIKYISNITIPSLFINSIDDPLIHSSCIAYDEIKSNHNCILLVTKYGGHLGWSELGFIIPDASSWVDKIVTSYISVRLMTNVPYS
jgi:predicted alpha/beta-fold hydrolase